MCFFHVSTGTVHAAAGLERSAPLTNDTGDDDDDYDPPTLQENVTHIDNANFKLIKDMANEHCNCHPHHDH